jgi:hypothetical protein
LKKHGVRVWTGFSWLVVDTVNTLMNHPVS